MAGTSVGTITVSKYDILVLRNQIVGSGQFPAREAFVFSEAHASNEERSLAVAEIGSVTGQTITENNLTVTLLFTRAAAQLDHAGIDGFLPRGFTCPPSTSRRRTVSH